VTRWLLIHGLPTGGRYWARMELHGEVVAPDLPGFGASRHLPVPQTVEGFLPALRPHAGPGTVVVGVDYGGVLAAALAAEGNAGKLVLMSTALGAAWLPSRWAARRPLAAPLYRWSSGQAFLRAADPTGQLAAAFPPDHGLPDRMITVARSLRVREQQQLAARIRVPTLCLWGDEDRFLPPWAGRALARRLRADWVTLPGRHAIAWTAAGATADVLTRWAGRD